MLKPTAMAATKNPSPLVVGYDAGVCPICAAAFVDAKTLPCGTYLPTIIDYSDLSNPQCDLTRSLLQPK